ncbi:unnamed protein product [Pleuronectes platessa]|uniref:Uncharacterized protein n=1 Tax=Pleuronectes platessa TaxID=8262 RepID=A0A9N7Y7U9_PLEPL|nr:unnamed protein product [Pleuronectes platessa]
MWVRHRLFPQSAVAASSVRISPQGEKKKNLPDLQALILLLLLLFTSRGINESRHIGLHGWLGLLRAAVFLMIEAFLPHPAHVCSSRFAPPPFPVILAPGPYLQPGFSHSPCFLILPPSPPQEPCMSKSLPVSSSSSALAPLPTSTLPGPSSSVRSEAGLSGESELWLCGNSTSTMSSSVSPPFPSSSTPQPETSP